MAGTYRPPTGEQGISGIGPPQPGCLHQFVSGQTADHLRSTVARVDSLKLAPNDHFVNQRRCLLIFVLALIPQLAVAQLTESMPLGETETALQAYPPDWRHGDERAKIMASLDRQVTVRVCKEMSDADRKKLLPVRDFYRRRVDIGLDKLARTRVAEGVHAFKFYSSSWVFKAKEGSVAVEFSQGPINNGGTPEERDYHRSGFYWHPDQRDRLAKLVDVSISTHRHHDHSDYSLAKRMLAAGKTVIVPAQLKTIWKDLAADLTVPQYDTVQRFGPLEIFTMLGSQFGKNELTGNGRERRGVPHPDGPHRDSETVVYLFRLAGIVFLTSGENHVPAGDWLKRGAKLGFKPNVRMSVGQFQGARSIDAVLKNMKPVFRLPLHEYEISHMFGGNRSGHLMIGSYRKTFERRQMMPMLWGEDFLITERLVEFTR